MATTTPSAATLLTRARPATYSTSQRKVAVLVVALAFALDLMDATILTIALPTIRHTMHAGFTSLNWMAAAYTMAFAVLLITGGRLGDVFGYRRLFVIGVAGFMVSSLLVGLAWSPVALIAARLLQGGSAALMVPQVLSVIQLLYKPDERVAVNGMLGGLGMLATTIAPIVTGLLIKANIAGLSWRPIFLINVPVCVAGIALASRYLPAGRSTLRPRVDWIGTLLAVTATALLIFPLIQGHDLGWPSWTWLMLGTSAGVFAALAAWQRRAARLGRSPLVHPSLFGRRSFSVGLCVSLLLFATTSCFALSFTLLLQAGHRFSAIHTVLTALFITVGLVVAVGSMRAKVIPALGRWSLTIGIAVMAGGTVAVGFIVAAAGNSLSTWQLAPALVVLGAGMSMVVMPLLPFVLSNVHRDDAGSASGVANAAQQVGSALGVALIGAVFFPSVLSGGYTHAFMAGVWLQAALLGLALVVSGWLPRRIAPAAYEQQW